jgi:hypothetical protein
MWGCLCIFYAATMYSNLVLELDNMINLHVFGMNKYL